MNERIGHSTTRKGTLDIVTGPSWLFLPDLRLLIGEGRGFLDAVKEAPTRIDDWVIPQGVMPCDDLMEELCDDLLSRRLPGSLPSVTAFHCRNDRTSEGVQAPVGVNASGGLLRRTLSLVDGLADWVTAWSVPLVGYHQLNETVRDEFRVGYAVTGRDDRSVTVGRRIRTLKPEYRRKMVEIGLEYAPGSGIGSRPKKPVGGARPHRPENGHAFAVWVSEMKEEFVAERRHDLIVHPKIRPANFLDVMNAAKRSRDAEVARGKKDGNGDPHVSLTEEQLVERAAGQIARSESSQCMFDIRYEPAIIYDRAGRIVIM